MQTCDLGQDRGEVHPTHSFPAGMRISLWKLEQRYGIAEREDNNFHHERGATPIDNSFVISRAIVQAFLKTLQNFGKPYGTL